MKKKLGILGLGNKSTVYSIEMINNQYHKIKGGYATCPFLMLNIDFDSVNQFLPDDLVAIERVLVAVFEEFKKAKITHLLIPNFTIHESVDRFYTKQKYNFELVHPLSLLKEKLIQIQPKFLIVLGTKFTSNHHYIYHLIPPTVEIVKLNEEEENKIEELRKHYYLNTDVHRADSIWESLRKAYSKEHYFVIACTELSIAFKKQQENKIDLLELQCLAAIFPLVN